MLFLQLLLNKILEFVFCNKTVIIAFYGGSVKVTNRLV